MADAQTKVAAIRAGFAVSILLLLTGCAATPIEKPKSFIRPVKTDINQVVAAASAAVSAQPIQSRGTLRFQEFKAGKAGPPENLNIQLRFTPPYHLYLKADSILGEAIRLGSNPEQFYLCFKPNEISSYFHGKWALANGCNSQLFISPQVILEALGNASVDNSMKLSTENNFYVLSKMDASGILLKKVYLDPQSYFTRRIEYFDINGDTAMEMTLNNYTSGDSAGIVVPTSMEISYFDGSDLASIVKIKLKGVKPFTPTEAQLKGKFNPPSTKGFKNVYELAGNCQFIKK
jgi:hypothetical protein